MAKRENRKMTEADLVALCSQEFNDADLLSSEIKEERSEALDYYNQEPFGNEEEGLSKYVSSDVRDAIEWIKPQIVDVFVGGDTPIIFEPENADDVKDADTESRYTQYVFERQNPGVIIATTWIGDALLQKNGIVKAWCEESQLLEREEYKGKSMADYMALKEDDEFEVTECTIYLNDQEFSEEEYTAILGALPTQAEAIDMEADYHIIGYRKRKIRQVKIENVPPEQFFMAKKHNSIFPKDSRFCGEFYEKTRSELIEMGYDRDLVDMLPASEGIIGLTSNEAETRRRKEGGINANNNNSGLDRSRELVMVYDYYIRADFNGDGVAEMRHVRTGAKGVDAVCLENEEVDRNIYHAITPYLNAYKFYGRSVADNLMDIQRAKSQLWRNGFDNVAFSAMPRTVVKGNADIPALLTWIQGGVVKADKDASVEPLVTPFIANEALLMADKMDMVRAERTGFSRDSMGLNPDALSKATNMVGMSILAQSQLLVKMMATIIANTGFKTLMEHVRELILKYEDKEKVFDLTGEFMTTDPRRWRKQRSSVPRVGIGFAGKQEEIAMLAQITEMQEKYVVAQGGNIDGKLVNSQGIFNAAKRLCRRVGIKDATTYFQDPQKYQAPEPQPTIADKTLQLNTEIASNQQSQAEAKAALDAQKAKLDHEYRIAELAQKERLEVQKMQQDRELAEQELLYKYGKDAHDRNHAHATNSQNLAAKGMTPPKPKGTPKNGKPAKSQD